MVAQEFCKLHKPNINKGWILSHCKFYLSIAAERYQSAYRRPELDREREVTQLAKGFTAKRACDEVPFYMGMITDDQQTFDGLVNHLKMHSCQGRLLAN